MKEKIKKILPKSKFTKNVLTLLTGSGIAQIIPVLASLILARLYSPQDFGVLALYISIITIIGSISSWRFEVAIILPKKDNEARSLFILSWYILFLMSFLYLVLAIIFDGYIVELLLKKTEFVNLRYFIHIGIFLLTSFQILSFWLNRRVRYTEMAKSKVIQSACTSLLSVLLVFFYLGPIGLILGSLFGQLFSSLYLLYNIIIKDKNIINTISLEKVFFLTNKYKKFPIYATPSGLFNTLFSAGLPVFIAFFYGAKIAGLFFFAMKIVRLPLDFMFSSFSQVYREKATELYHENKLELLSFTKKVQKRIILIMIPILLLTSFIAPTFFSYFFGKEWIEAGEIVKYFVIFIFLNGIYSPISSIGDILMEQKAVLFFNLSISITQILILYLMHTNFKFNTTILINSIICGTFYIVLDLYMKRVLKSKLC